MTESVNLAYAYCNFDMYLSSFATVLDKQDISSIGSTSFGMDQAVDILSNVLN